MASYAELGQCRARHVLASSSTWHPPPPWRTGIPAAVLVDCAVGPRFIAALDCARRLPAPPPHALRRSCRPTA